MTEIWPVQTRKGLVADEYTYVAHTNTRCYHICCIRYHARLAAFALFYDPTTDEVYSAERALEPQEPLRCTEKVVWGHEILIREIATSP